MEGQFHSLIDIFKTGKEQYPEKTAIIMGEDTRTYGQIFDNAKRIAGFVLEKEIKPQDKVAVISKELFHMTDTYILDIADPKDALHVLMFVLAIDAEKCSRNRH